MKYVLSILFLASTVFGAQVQTGNIANNAVTDTKIRTANGAYIRGRNAADSGDVNMCRVNSSDQIEFAALPVVSGLGALATQSYVGSNAVSSSSFTAKGDIPVGTGSGAYSMVSACSNGQSLQYDSTQSNGVKCVTVAGGTGDIKSNGSVAFAADESMGGFKITNLANPISGSDAANKTYVDTAIGGSGVVSAIIGVDAVDTVGVTLSGVQTVDGFVTGNGNRVLEAIPTAGVDNGNTVNGVYITSSSGAWTRSTDMNSASQFYRGMKVLVGEGTGGVQYGSTWQLLTAPPYVLGTTKFDFENENLTTFPNTSDWHWSNSVYAHDVSTTGFDVFVDLFNPFSSNKTLTLLFQPPTGFANQSMHFDVENAASVHIPTLKSSGNFSNKTTDNPTNDDQSLVPKHYVNDFHVYTTNPISSDPGLDFSTNGALFFVDTSGGAVNFQLVNPATQNTGYKFYIKDAKNTFGTNAFTLKKFGSTKTEYVNADFVMNTNGAMYVVFTDGTDWYVGKMTP